MRDSGRPFLTIGNSVDDRCLISAADQIGLHPFSPTRLMPTHARMSRFEIFIGTWNTHGEVLATDQGLASTLVGTDTYRWLPGRHFIVHEVDVRFGGTPTRCTELVGYDAASKKYQARSYDDQGASESFEVILNGKRWSIFGEKVRFKGKFNQDSEKLEGLWELKSQKSGWQPWINLELVRA
jgi:hypothetical protein